MKTALAIVCSFLLAGTPLLLAQTPQVSVAKVDCSCGGKMACCTTQPAPASQPLTASPVLTGNQNQLSVPPQNIVAWVLPDAASPGFSPIASTSFSAPGTALYARDCARLI